jgi:hypothetical protein
VVDVTDHLSGIMHSRKRTSDVCRCVENKRELGLRKRSSSTLRTIQQRSRFPFEKMAKRKAARDDLTVPI